MVFGLQFRRRRGAREAVIAILQQLPYFLRLLYRLLRDPRVRRADKALVLGVMAYILTPADLLPDFLGFLGMVDDLYLLGLALDRLLRRAGPDLLLDHWDGNPRALQYLVERVEQIGALVPAPVRALLRGRLREA